MLKTSVGAAGAVFLLGNGYGSPAFADQLASTGTVAGGFVVNGRHLAFGADPQHQMAVAGQLFNLNTYNAVPSGIRVRVEYGTDPSYGAVATAELRELVTHVSKCPSVYSFTYSNVAIVSVDANELSYEIQGLLGYSHGTQAAWLKQRLAEFRADPAIDFIVAFFHHCAFSTCSSHSSDGGVRSTLAPLFAEHQVDLAVQGHNHLYERTNPIRYDAATNFGKSSVQAVSRSPREAAVVHPATDGTTYVVVGSVGRPRYTWGLSHGLRASRLSRRRGAVAVLRGGWRRSGVVVPGGRDVTLLLLLLRRASRRTAHYPDD